MNEPYSRKFIVMCVTILGGICLVAGSILTWRGYNAELLVGGGVGAITGLLGVLSNRSTVSPQPDISVSASGTEVTQPKSEETKTIAEWNK